MATITVTKGLIGKEDISFEAADTTPSTFTRTAQGGATQAITKLAAAHINIEDSAALIAGTNVETALAEVATDIVALGAVTEGGQGADIASSATIQIPSKHFLFDVTGTTNISAITVDTGGVAGRLIALQFDGVLTVSSSATVKLHGDFSTLNGSLLLLIYDGTSWRELARSGGATAVPPGGGAVTGSTAMLHAGPVTPVQNNELGDCYGTSPADTDYYINIPLNGFVGGQNERGTS